jgi:hypothetical protein
MQQFCNFAINIVSAIKNIGQGRLHKDDFFIEYLEQNMPGVIKTKVNRKINVRFFCNLT